MHIPYYGSFHSGYFTIEIFHCLYITRVNDIIKTSLFKIVWLNVYHWYVMFFTMYIILSLWSLYRLLTIIWFPIVQWRLYKSTHCGLNKFVGTWNIHHHAKHDLKAYLATLTSSLFIEGFGICTVWFTAAMRARWCSSPTPSVCV